MISWWPFPNFGAQCIIDSGMGDPMGYVDTDLNPEGPELTTST
jgi:hypothetical protein